MTPPEPVGDPLGEVRAGRESAATDLYVQYAQRLMAYADRHLAAHLAARVDGAEVVQSVFRTFFRRAKQGEFRVETAGDVWRLLIHITANKVRAAARYHTAAMRDPSREAVPTDASPDPVAGLVGRDPGAEELAAFGELVRELVAAHTPLHGKVLELRLAGCGPNEIADELGVTRQTVHRHLTRMGEWLQRHTTE